MLSRFARLARVPVRRFGSARTFTTIPGVEREEENQRRMERRDDVNLNKGQREGYSDPTLEEKQQAGPAKSEQLEAGAILEDSMEHPSYRE